MGTSILTVCIGRSDNGSNMLVGSLLFSLLLVAETFFHFAIINAKELIRAGRHVHEIRFIKKHGISFKSAARIFFDYDRIEFYDEDHSYDEDRYNTIGDTSAGRISQKTEGALIGNIDQFIGKVNEILFVVYTERVRIEESGTKTDVTRLISARMATEFERGLYYGKNE